MDWLTRPESSDSDVDVGRCLSSPVRGRARVCGRGRGGDDKPSRRGRGRGRRHDADAGGGRIRPVRPEPPCLAIVPLAGSSASSSREQQLDEEVKRLRTLLTCSTARESFARNQHGKTIQAAKSSWARTLDPMFNNISRFMSKHALK